MTKNMGIQSRCPNPPHVKIDFFRSLEKGEKNVWLPALDQADIEPPDKSVLPSTIPKRISQYWHSETLPDDVACSIGRVKNNNPDFELALTHDESVRAFLPVYNLVESVNEYLAALIC